MTALFCCPLFTQNAKLRRRGVFLFAILIFTTLGKIPSRSLRRQFLETKRGG